MAYISLNIDMTDVASQLEDDFTILGELLSEIGDRWADALPTYKLNDFLEGLSDEGRRLVKQLAAAIDAEAAP